MEFCFQTARCLPLVLLQSRRVMIAFYETGLYLGSLGWFEGHKQVNGTVSTVDADG